MTIDRLTGFRDRHYDSGNIAFAIVGDIDEETAVQYFEEILDPHSCHGGEKKDWPNLEIDYSPYEFEHASKQTFLQLTMRGPSPAEEEKLKYVNEVFLNGYGGSANSLLFKRIRQELGLCYAVGAFERGFGDNNSTNVYTMLDAKNADKATEEAIALLRQVQKEGFDEETLEIAKKNSAFVIANQIITPAGFSAVCFDRYFTHGLTPPEDVIKTTASITNEDIMQYAAWIEEQGIKLIKMNG
jgi:predicted Zn-dependent peptidase